MAHGLSLAEARSLVLEHSGRKRRRLSMTLEQFIRKNRRQLDRAIKRIWPKVKLLNDAERKVWILNDIRFLLWLEARGVKINEEYQSITPGGMRVEDALKIEILKNNARQKK
jgi:hypothetical protein